MAIQGLESSIRESHGNMQYSLVNKVNSLKNIIANSPEDFILDSSALRVEYKCNGFIEETYDSKKAAHLDSTSLAETLDSTIALNEIAELGNVYFIPEITREVKSAREILSKKLSWFGRMSDGSSKSELNIETINQIALEVLHLTDKIKKKEIKHNNADQLYPKILEFTNLISERFDEYAKYSNKPFFYHRKKEKLNNCLGTDEKLIATVLTKAFNEKRDCSFVSNDILLVKKLIASYLLLSCEEMGLFKELKNHNIKSYGQSLGEYALYRETSRLEPQMRFILFIANDKQNAELRAKAKNLFFKKTN